MKDQPFIVRQRANIHSSAPFNQNEDAVEKTKKVGKFVAKQAIKQGLKTAGQKALAGAFGIAGSLLNPTKLYAQDKSSADVATEQYLKNNPDAKLVRSIEDLQ